MDKKVIGIIGGTGPLATADLFQKIVLHTRAATDREHLHVLIDNNTAIPDRTAAILSGGEDPTAELIKSARLLEAAGAELLVMPCNTAHYFHAAVQASVKIPLLNMIGLTYEALLARGVRTAALLATRGTVCGGVYQRVFEGSLIRLLTPTEEEQAVITDLIYGGVKAGRWDYDATAARAVMERLCERGAETLILGCTELPVAAGMYRLDFNTCDPTTELALGAIRAAGGVCI